MIDQLKTIRAALEEAHDESLDENHFECRQILMAQIAALTKLYAAPVAQQHETVTNDEQARAYMDARLWEFIDMAGMWPKAKPDPRIWAHVMVYAPPAQQPQKLEDVEQYRMQMAGISTAAMGYWKEGDSIHPDYDTPALRDVAKLYAKYDALYKAQQPQAEAVREQLRAAQVAATMPLIGPLLDAWDGLPNDFKYAEELSNLRKQIGEINMAMEGVQPQQAEAVPSIDALEQEIYENTREFVPRSVMDWMLQRYYPAAPQQAEAVPPDVVRDADLALDLLSKLFNAYENGLACYEDPDEQAGYVGNAVELDADTIHACADLLNRRRPIAAIAQQKGQP